MDRVSSIQGVICIRGRGGGGGAEIIQCNWGMKTTHILSRTHSHSLHISHLSDRIAAGDVLQYVLIHACSVLRDWVPL